jgi:hypothetical protein
MTTNLDIIKRAMKKLHVLAAGTNPSSAQAADGMDALQSLYVELIGQGSLGRLHDVLATANYTAKENERIQAAHGITITLPLVITPTDCSYSSNYSAWYGWPFDKPRPVRDRACVIVVQDGAATYSVFRASTDSWVTINGLTQQGSFPFTDTLVDGFAALLAERLADNYSTVAGPSTQQAARACRWMLAGKPDSTRPPVRAEYF